MDMWILWSGIILFIIALCTWLSPLSKLVFECFLGELPEDSALNFLADNGLGLICIMLMGVLGLIQWRIWKIPVWNVVLYIQNNTNLGKDKHWSEVRVLLERYIRGGDLKIWVKKSPGKSFNKLNLRELSKAFLDIQPSEKIGKIRIISENIFWDSPVLSRRQVMKFLKKK